MSMEKFGARLADLRKKAELTQAALAEKLDVSDRAVSKWENAGGYPDITLLPQIADIFGVTIDYLLRGTPVKRQHLCLDYTNTKFKDAVNKNYLSKGWRVKDMELAGDGEGNCSCALVLEKDDYFGE
ncbi:MAG: helix-turn-helix transcriptional regulator [Clostridia bacterium]|nr:helix-turn-helix transcriptional regulator [Clostridia bacterium]